MLACQRAEGRHSWQRRQLLQTNRRKNRMLCQDIYKKFSITGLWNLRQEVDEMRAVSLWWDAYDISSVQSLSRVWLFATPWIVARQASLSITISRSSVRLTSNESLMPSSHLILCCPLLLLPPIPPSFRVFSNESTYFAQGGQSTGVSALASFLPKKSQGWSPSEWTGWDSLQSKGLSRVFSNTIVQKHQFFSAQPSSQSNSWSSLNYLMWHAFK